MVDIRLRKLTKTFGKAVAVNNIDLEIRSGTLTTLLGPSGCGKTTSLRCIAGLETPDSGSIEIGDMLVFSKEKNVKIPPNRRKLGMVFQSYAVWPHMTVSENVAFPLKVQKIPEPQIRERVSKSLRTVGLEGFEERHVTQLSGGQQQRVALSRAIVAEPQALLFDEPLSNLDAKLRERMRFEILDLQRKLGITTIYVTHDQAEAMVMSDDIVVMNEGHIMQRGTAEELYNKPENKFVGDFIGLTNFLPGKVTENPGKKKFGTVMTSAGPICASLVKDIETGKSILVSVRPENVMLSKEQLSGDNVIQGEVKKATFLGNIRDYLICVGKEVIRAQADSDIILKPGEKVYVQLAPEKCIAIP
jgi:iron(III) transport system ATP-binding protein